MGMNRLLLVMLVLAECSIASAGPRNCRPRNQRWVCQPQPACCQSTPTVAAQCATCYTEDIRPLADTRACALYPAGFFNGYTFYYSLKCPSMQPTGLSGNFTPAGACPVDSLGTACVPLSFISLSVRGATDPKLNAKAPHDEMLDVRNSDNTVKPEFKTVDGLNGGRRFVRFDAGGKTVFAKLHVIEIWHLENLAYVKRGEFPIGQEILPPQNGNYNPTPVPPRNVGAPQHNLVKVKVGNDWYEIVTEQDLIQ